jgi:hypothetical protein
MTSTFEILLIFSHGPNNFIKIFLFAIPFPVKNTSKKSYNYNICYLKITDDIFQKLFILTSYLNSERVKFK